MRVLLIQREDATLVFVIGQSGHYSRRAFGEVAPFGHRRRRVLIGMSDHRNVAHAKKVTQEKHHQEAKRVAKPRRDKKTSVPQPNQPGETPSMATSTSLPKEVPKPGDLEKSLAVLSKLKDMEFHSRANIETLAELTLTIEEELKQREFSEPIGAVYSAQDAFHSKIAAMIEAYQTKCDALKSPT